MEDSEFCATVEALRGLEPAQLELVGDLARLLTGPDDLTESQIATGAVTALRISSAAEGAGASWLRRFESTVFWAADGARSPAAWLDSHAECSKIRAGSSLKRARTLSRLPAAEAAFAAGRIGDEKIRILLHYAKLDTDLIVEHQQHLVDTLATITVEGTHLFLHGWYRTKRPPAPSTDAEDGPPPEVAGGKTHLQFSKTTGGSHVAGFLGTETAAVVTGAIEAEIDAWFRAGLLEGDTRTRPELYAAAIEAITARHGLTGDQHGQTRPLALILADADTLSGRVPTADSPNMAPVSEIIGHGPISPDTARRLLCGADTSRIILRGDSEVLDVGMTQRFATPAQRRGIIAAADGRCEFPGCDAPHNWCQIHHLDPFNPRAGTGPSDLANLALVCSRHHHALHEGRFTMTRGPTGTTVRKPDGTVLTVPLTHRPRNNTPRDG